MRDYGTPPLVWGGDAEHAHIFGTAEVTRRGNLNDGFNHRWNENWSEGGAQIEARPLELVRGSFCACGAWLGSLGLEPVPDLFIEHLVEVFRHVRRVLRDDGTLWLNMGDSHAGSGNGSKDYRDPGASLSTKRGFDGTKSGEVDVSGWRGGGRVRDTSANGVGSVSGYKPKDLMMMPFRVAMALQQDGWWIRSVIPWIKRNAMPESVTDRPSNSIEYVFLLAKSKSYYWDADAVRIASPSSVSEEEYAAIKARGTWPSGGQTMHAGSLKDAPSVAHPSGRNRRNGDWFMESWRGLLLDEQDDPLALVVNPQPFSGAHFATFPAKLVEPMVKASTRPGDTILDPFAGSGTVGLVADRLQRNAILCELKPGYADMAVERVTQDAPLFAEVAAD